MFKRIIAVAILISATGFLSSCGVPGGGSSSCTGNITNSELNLLVTKLGQNSYSMQLCSNSNGNIVNVYGGNSSLAVQALTLTTNNTAPRKPMVDNFIQAGSTIQVDFYASDTHFSIYPVVFVGGQYLPDFNHPLVSAQPLPF